MNQFYLIHNSTTYIIHILLLYIWVNEIIFFRFYKNDDHTRF